MTNHQYKIVAFEKKDQFTKLDQVCLSNHKCLHYFQPLSKVSDFSEELNQFLSKYFNIYGNCSVESSEVLCFGEIHSRFDDNMAIQGIINRIGQANDVVLIEGRNSKHPISRLINSTTSFIKVPNIKIKGWDNLSVKQGIEKRRRLLYQDSNFIKRVKKESQLNYRTVQQRNLSMIKAISRNLARHKKIFVIAGLGHLDSILDDGSELSELYSYLNKKRYLIFLPKYEELDNTQLSLPLGKDKWTAPFFNACYNGQPSIVKFFCENGIALDIKDQRGQSARDYAKKGLKEGIIGQHQEVIDLFENDRRL